MKPRATVSSEANRATMAVQLNLLRHLAEEIGTWDGRDDDPVEAGGVADARVGRPRSAVPMAQLEDRGARLRALAGVAHQLVDRAMRGDDQRVVAVAGIEPRVAAARVLPQVRTTRSSRLPSVCDDVGDAVGGSA